MASILVARDPTERARIAAGVVTGIGFLGAGAIIHERRAVVGLTTAATIWAVAAIGVLVGIGYAAAGIVLSFFIFLILTFLRILEGWMFGPCKRVTARVRFRPDNGKTKLRVIGVLDASHVPHASYRFSAWSGDEGKAAALQDCVEVEYCSVHRLHRIFLSDLASLPEVEAIEHVDGVAQKELDRSPAS